MIDSVPLIQNPNDAQQINASIIAMKKASRELNEKIVKLNSLNSELDKKIALLDSGLNKEIEDRKEAINSLDVSSVGGSGKYISAISETDGKISATVSDLTSVIESGNNQPATSGGVADAIQGVISLPTDAVLHYSFDEVPDYPDGTAVYFKNKDWTVSDNWNVQTNNATYSVDNGVAVWTLTNNGRLDLQKNISNIAGKILKIKFRFSASGKEFRVIGKVDTNFVRLATYTTNGEWQEATLLLRSDITTELILSVVNDEINSKLEISSIYIGNGSYSTPIIDNANGQNNATNYGGIAVQGVSGKGAYFLNGKYAQVSNFNFTKDFTVTVWVKPNNADVNLGGDILIKSNVVYIRNGRDSEKFYVAIYNINTSEWQFIRTNELLPANKYTHIAIVKNGTNLKIFFDASLKKGSTIVEDIASNNNPLNISYSNNTRPQSIDDLLIFDRALTENEVMALYLNKANTPKYYSWADWKLNQMENANRSIVAETRNIEEPPIEESGEEER